MVGRKLGWDPKMRQAGHAWPAGGIGSGANGPHRRLHHLGIRGGGNEGTVQDETQMFLMFAGL